MEFTTVIVRIALLIALAIPGYLLRKFKVFDSKSVAVLVALLVYVSQPLLVAQSFLSNKYNAETFINILIAIGIFTAVILLVLVISCCIFRKTHSQDESVAYNHRIYQFASMFGNTGFLGIPFIKALFPDNTEMLLYTSMCIVAFNLLCWTLGVFVISRDKKLVSVKKVILSPVPIAIIVTIPFFFMTNLVIPAPVIDMVRTLGDTTTPLSMIVMGIRLAELPIKEVFSDVSIYIVSALRLLAAPCIAYLLLTLLGITDANLFNTLIVLSAMPSAASTIVMAEKYSPNSYTAIKAVLCTAIICIITVPLLSMFLLI